MGYVPMGIAFCKGGAVTRDSGFGHTLRDSPPWLRRGRGWFEGQGKGQRVKDKVWFIVCCNHPWPLLR